MASFNLNKMKRRKFIQHTAFTAFAVSAFGFVRFNGSNYVGDCETTSDILGPFYRPGSPVRNNLVIPGEAGTLLQLSGKIKHNDCVTPYKNAKIELWHCDAKGVYDNASSDFKYRGTTYSDENGKYEFATIYPVPYDVGNGHTRPAHFHLMITAAGYQPLVTQLYFTGDKNIVKDPSAASPAAKRRILDVIKKANGTSKVLYDVSMSPRLLAEPEALDKLTGHYTSVKDKNKSIDLFKNEHTLWMKNEVFGEGFLYTGNNTFEYPGSPKGFEASIHFEFQASGAIQLTFDYIDDDAVKHQEVYLKAQ
jgi:catechol 1,2-dioxygenase